jgi:hypothetical protein
MFLAQVLAPSEVAAVLPKTTSHTISRGALATVLTSPNSNVTRTLIAVGSGVGAAVESHESVHVCPSKYWNSSELTP